MPDKEKKTPSPKQVQFMNSIASRKGIEIPDDAYQNLPFVLGFLKEHGPKVTEKQQNAAKAIAKRLGIDLPEHVLTSPKVMREFLNTHITKPEKEGATATPKETGAKEPAKQSVVTKADAKAATEKPAAKPRASRAKAATEKSAAKPSAAKAKAPAKAAAAKTPGKRAQGLASKRVKSAAQEVGR